MQRLTIAERLLVVALLPALALLVRHLFGPPEEPIWLLFGAAVSILTPLLAVFVGLSITTPIRRATQAINGLAGSGSRGGPEAREARAEIVRLSAAIATLLAATAGRKRAESESARLEQAERAARRANLTTMASEIEASTERGLKTVVNGSVALCGRTEDMRGALTAAHAASEQAAEAADH